MHAKNVLIEAVKQEMVDVADSAQRRTSSSSELEEGATAGSQLEQLRKRVRLEKQAEVRDNVANCTVNIEVEYAAHPDQVLKVR